MGFFNKEVELLILPKKQDTNNKTVKVKSLNGYGTIREKVDESNTAMRHTPVEQPTRLKPKVTIGL